MSDAVDRLLEVMRRLRDPQGGCPWDLEQNFETIAPYTIEEAYEVAEAIEDRDWAALRDELGDLLFQVVFYAQMGREAGHFDFDAIVEGVIDKMLRRHPHVFGAARVENAEAQSRAWEAHKAAERVGEKEKSGVLDGVARTLPGLTRAAKLQARAARVGFDWPEITEVLAKIDEEVAEIKAEIDSGDNARLGAEIGDLLFATVNLARHAGTDPDAAIRATNNKFERRFRYIEKELKAKGKTPSEATLAEMDALWEDAKHDRS